MCCLDTRNTIRANHCQRMILLPSEAQTAACWQQCHQCLKNAATVSVPCSTTQQNSSMSHNYRRYCNSFVFTLYEVKIVPLPQLMETYAEVYKLTYPYASILYHRLHTVKLWMASGLRRCIICLQFFHTQHSVS